MPRGTLSLLIDNRFYDARATWGLSLSDGGVSTLLSMPSVKERISNASRLENGKRIVDAPVQFDSREITLAMHIIAPNFNTFLTNYRDFVRKIALTQEPILLTYVIYGVALRFRLRYKSCTQFGVYDGTLAKFAVRFDEEKPNLGEIV